MRFAGLHVPTEWIAAHGLRPERVLPSPVTGCACAAGMCQVAAQIPAGPVIVTTQCDQLRRSPHQGFLLDVPAAWQGPSALGLWRDELERLGRWLVTQGGTAPDRARLMAAADAHDRVRARLRALSGDAGQKHERISAWLCDGLHSDEALAPERGIPVALCGGPLPRGGAGWFAACAAAGLHLALDGSEAGERGLAPPLDRRLLREDPLQAIAEAHLAMPDPGRRPDTALHGWISAAVAERALRGIILRCDPFCDQWQLQAERLRHWAPVLLVEDGEAPARLSTRLEAFAEMLAC